MRTFLLAGCLTFSAGLLGQSHQDIPTTAPIHLKASGLTTATLSMDCTLGGHDLGAGTSIRLGPDGSLRGFVLVRTTALSGVPLPRGTVVTLAPNGLLYWCFLPRDTDIQGHVLRGHGHDWMTTFHPNGRLKLGWLARDEVIDGIPCRRTTFLREFLRLDGWGGTSFHANGRLASCALSASTVIQGRSLRKNTRVRFDPEGRLL